MPELQRLWRSEHDEISRELAVVRHMFQTPEKRQLLSGVSSTFQRNKNKRQDDGMYKV
jgi:hypothetical protein